MAVELMLGYRNDTAFSAKMEETAVKEAASGLESVGKLIKLLSHSQQQHHAQAREALDPPPPPDLERDCQAVADDAVCKFKNVISLLGRTRTGHARFRRAPVQPGPEKPPNPQQKIYYATPIQQIPPSPAPGPALPPGHYGGSAVIPKSNGVIGERRDSSTTISFSYAPSDSSNPFGSSLTADNINGNLNYNNVNDRHAVVKQQQCSSSSTFQITSSSVGGKPPLSSSSSLKRKCSSETLGSGRCASSSGRCHCSKKRKLRLKRVVRVPAISLKMADIPPDEYSWRKYGQKPIKGSPHPRGYYKCSSVRGCPARKHVERALDDPAMLVVTYEGEHNHSLSVADSTSLILESS
ncbi:hypothetical protein BT93_I0499 [Corymbia citriodora subsp. variegata]|nr:hypothetical protein BT93_I0499 [Corymbia citriodora subsp. variegata]